MGTELSIDPTAKPTTKSEVDFLIVGQGLSGTFLSYFLLKAGKKVLVIDDGRSGTASKVASGVINPVTGRRIVRTWRIDELLPFALQTYQKLETEWGTSLVKQCSVLDFHPNLQMKDAFEKRLTEETEYLHTTTAAPWSQYFNFHYDIGEISPCLLINIHELLTQWRARLGLTNSLLRETFAIDNSLVTDNTVVYKNIIAKKIIFCDGVAGVENLFFKNLPYAPNKGEAIIVQIDDLPKEHIYKQGLSIVPWKEDLFWIGSSYEWNFTDDQPTSAFHDRVVQQLQFWLKLPFKVVDHLASIRPANMERRPFVGLHPNHPAVGILNGMGTKGCSLAPFFAKQMADLLTNETPVYPDADVKRFKRILERKMN